MILLSALAFAISTVPDTDFGIRPVRAEFASVRPVIRHTEQGASGFSLSSVAGFVAQFGRVTSLKRSPDHNRRVGGASNSWHLHGRAVDVVRSSGVSHASLAASLRQRGYHLLESLDEGDHSHFAFGNGLRVAPRRSGAEQMAEIKREADYFRFIEVPSPRQQSRKSALR